MIDYKKEIKILLKNIRSPKLTLWTILTTIFLFLILLSFIGLFLSFVIYRIKWMTLSLLILMVIFFSCLIIFTCLALKELKILTKQSFLFYKKISYKLFFYYTEIIITLILTLFFSAFQINIDTLLSINLTLLALVFTIYIFVLPAMNNYLQNISENSKTNKGYIYKQKILINISHVNIIALITIFIGSIFLVYSTPIMVFSSFLSLSISFELINIFILLYVIQQVYNYKIDELEKEMYEEYVNTNKNIIVSEDNDKKKVTLENLLPLC